jgi:hypothetical protein
MRMSESPSDRKVESPYSNLRGNEEAPLGFEEFSLYGTVKTRSEESKAQKPNRFETMDLLHI